MRPYYTLHLHGDVASSPDIADTIRAMTHRPFGGQSDLRGRWTLWTFALRRERDSAERFALRWAREHGLAGDVI